MMAGSVRTLILFRHGKAEPAGAALDDHERGLAPRGVEAARAMGRLLARAGEAPDSALTSTARRARGTLELAREAGGWSCQVRASGALYESEPRRVLEEIRAEPESTGILLLCGHEPTWSELARLLAGGGRLRFPTAAMARIDLSIQSWREADFDTGELVWLIPPRALGAPA
jgi:phosphohistidine phosphatase